MGINIDHVYNIRNARGSVQGHIYVATKVRKIRQDGITAHLREDRRPFINPKYKVLSKIKCNIRRYGSAMNAFSIKPIPKRMYTCS